MLNQYPMDIAALEQELIAGGYHGWYLAGGQLDDTVTLNRTVDGWEVYYSERGKKYNVRPFTTEDEACRYFLAFISRDGSTFGNS
ncbi:hypothetical protein GCM10027272_23820 [Hymenobacter frigidus]